MSTDVIFVWGGEVRRQTYANVCVRLHSIKSYGDFYKYTFCDKYFFSYLSRKRLMWESVQVKPMLHD